MYPLLEINVSAIENNARVASASLKERGIMTAGVVKVFDGAPEAVDAYIRGGITEIASSRVLHLKELKARHPEIRTLLIRIPMIAEAADVVRYADSSLNSEAAVLDALSAEAVRQGKTHKAILMVDAGDRREGVPTVEGLVELALYGDKLPGIEIAGIGVNYGCVSGVMPDKDNLEFVAGAARSVEQALGRKLEVVSGGSSSSFILLNQGFTFPKEINHFRLGGFIANPLNMHVNRGVVWPGMREDTVLLKAQIVELKAKSSVSAGHVGKNWKGEDISFEDKGERLRAIVAVGCQDIGDGSNLFPQEEGVSVIAASSDHVVLDVTDSPVPFKVGDVLTFRLRYGAILYALSTRHIEKKYVTD